MTVEEFEKAVGSPLHEWGGQCHAAALALVKSGVLGKCRVARGTCPGVFGQHSWVVLGWDCYDPKATVVDPTLWSYDEEVDGVWVGKANALPHRPHGTGSIWEYGRPHDPTGPIITLDGELPARARMFLDMLGPLDYEGWSVLAHAPVGGWPAKEIIGAMAEHEVLRQLPPIDIVGMVTDLNPSGLYF